MFATRPISPSSVVGIISKTALITYYAGGRLSGGGGNDLDWQYSPESIFSVGIFCMEPSL